MLSSYFIKILCKEEDFGVASFGLGDESPLRVPKGFNRKELERIQSRGMN